MPKYDLLLLHYSTAGKRYLIVKKETISHE